MRKLFARTLATKAPGVRRAAHSARAPTTAHRAALFEARAFPFSYCRLSSPRDQRFDAACASATGRSRCARAEARTGPGCLAG